MSSFLKKEALCVCNPKSNSSAEVGQHLIKSGLSRQDRQIAKLDLKSASKTVRRNYLLRECSQRAPYRQIGPSCLQLSLLTFSQSTVPPHPTKRFRGSRSLCYGSQRGGNITSSEISIWYFDDVILGCPALSVFAGVRKCVTGLKRIGLEFSPSNVKSST